MTVLDRTSFRHALTITRRINRDLALAVSVVDGPMTPIMTGLLQDASAWELGQTDGAPRDVLPKQELWWSPASSFADDSIVVGPGWRIAVQSVEYEVLTARRTIRGMGGIYAYHVHVLPVAELYAYEVELQKLGGEVITTLPMSIWAASATDRVTDVGFYLDAIGDAPVEYFDTLAGTNLQLVVGGRTFKIGSVSRMLVVPHVALQLTEA